jgi:hypothetical protein
MQKQLLGVVVSGSSDVDALLLQVRKNAVLLQVHHIEFQNIHHTLTLCKACAFVRQPLTQAAANASSPSRNEIDMANFEGSQNM